MRCAARLTRTLVPIALLLGVLFLIAAMASIETLLIGCRLTNVPLGIILAGGYYLHINELWARYSPGERLVRVGILALLLAAAGGSAEAFVTHGDLGYRTAAKTLALLIFAAGLLMQRRENHTTP